MAHTVVQIRSYRKRFRKEPVIIAVMDDGSEKSLEYETVSRFRLAAGSVFSDAEFEALCRFDETRKCQMQIGRWMALRPRSRGELQSRLQRNGYSAPVIQAVIDALVQQGQLDDDDFARRYIRSRIQRARKGPQALRADLFKYGIAPAVADRALSELFSEEQERALALRIGRRKLSAWRGKDDTNRSRKLAAFLHQRGFSPTVVRDVTRSLLGASGDP